MGLLYQSYQLRSALSEIVSLVTITAKFLAHSLGYFCSQHENRHLADAVTRVQDTFSLPSAASRASLVER